MINSFINSWKKSSRLRNYSRILSTDTFNKDALGEIIKLSFWYPNEPVIKYHSINEEKLEEKYSQLIKFGAGQYFRGHWIAASSLVFGMTLDYLFDEKNQMDGRENGDRVAYRLIEFFDKGQIGELYEGQIDLLKSRE